MAFDKAYTNLAYDGVNFKHFYGANLVLLANAWTHTMLARACQSQTVQPQMNHYLEVLYRYMLSECVARFFPRKLQNIATRMHESDARAVLEQDLVDPSTPVVCVGLARAGTHPNHILFEELCYLLDPKKVRQDHFYINRMTNQQGEVTGVNVSGSKIGGDKQDAIVLFPDPMGATGSSLKHCYDHYQKQVHGKARRLISMHLIVTPEFIRRMQKDCPELTIITLRVDRGTSDKEILSTELGSSKLESGLNTVDYIIPGAGGVGEVLNNSYV
jgi:uracil phosphoribosyltransferase